MTNEIKNDLGKIIFSEELIATLAGVAATECYGLVGMSSKKITDGIAELLGRENLSRGVKVEILENNLVVDLNVVIGYGNKIPEVAMNVMDKVKYTLEKTTGLTVAQVNVNVQGVRVIG